MRWPSFNFNPCTVLVVFLALLGAINHYSQSILSEVLFLAIRRVGVLFRLAFLYLLPAYRFGRLFSLARSNQSILTLTDFSAIRRVGVLVRLTFFYNIPAYRLGRLFSNYRLAIIQSNIISCLQHRVLLFVLY